MTLLPHFNASQSREAFLDFDFSNSLNFTNTTVGNFSCPFPPSPPPDEGGRPISGHLGMLNIELLHTLSRWSLEKIEQVYKKQQNALLKAMIEGLSSKLSKAFDQLCIKSYASKSQFVIPQQWIVFPLFGASSMSFQPINNAPDFQFNLSPPDPKDSTRTLTLQWKGQRVEVLSHVVGSPQSAAAAASSSIAAEAFHHLVPLSLNPNMTVYVALSDSTSALAQTMIGYIQLEQELEAWTQQEGLTLKEQQGRQEAKRRILECMMTSSTTLNLQNLNLTSLPESFSHLSKLTELNLRDTQLQALPDNFGQLKALTKLNLSDTNLQALPESFGQLSSLTTLHLSSGNLQALPESFGQLKALKELNLSANPRLQALPGSFGQLKALTELSLKTNNLQALPESFGQLEALTKLSLFGNRLQVLPESFWQLKALTNLDLSFNCIRVLSEDFGQLSALRELDVSTNRLQALPESIGLLSNLTKLIIANNPFRSLPNSIIHLPSSFTIDLIGHNLSERTLNSLRTLLQEHLDRGERVPRFLFSMPPPREGTHPVHLEQAFQLLYDLVEQDPTLQFDRTLFSIGNHPARLWLHNLLQTSDFTSGSIELKKKLAEVVLKAFKYAAEHQDFQELFSLFLDTANVSCVDRITLSLIELEILIELKMRSSEPDPRAAQLLLKSVWVTHLLHEFAHQVVMQMPLVDELDVHLAFLIHCKAPLKKLGIDLPFSSENMHFFGITGLRPEHLDRAIHRVKEQVNSGHASEQFIEFLFLAHNVIAKFSLDLFEKIFAKETEQIKKDKEAMLEKVEHFIAKKQSVAFNPKEVEESNLPQLIKSLFLQESLPDADVMKLYQEITRWQKMQYARLSQFK